MTITVLIADDHPIVRDGLRGILSAEPAGGEEGFEVLGEAADGAEAVALAERLRPAVVLMDLRMPGTDGVTAISELARLGNPARVLRDGPIVDELGHVAHRVERAQHRHLLGTVAQVCET